MASHILILIFVCICLTVNYTQSSEHKDDLINDRELVIDDPVKIEYLHKKENCERLTKNGDEVHMHYTGRLSTPDGKQFDTSIGRTPLKFRLGDESVIKGWEEGLLEMCVGEKRRLTIPPSKGYGSESAGESIPPDSTLVFEVELMKISDGGVQGDDQQTEGDESFETYFHEIDTNKDGHVTKEEFAVYIRETNEGLGEEVSPGGGSQEMVDQIFGQEDKNNDGIVTLDEFLADKHDEL